MNNLQEAANQNGAALLLYHGRYLKWFYTWQNFQISKNHVLDF